MDSAQPQRIAVVVVGMHRSGTSALTRALSAAGLALPPDVGRRLWESRSIIMLDNQVLARFGMHWFTPGVIAAERFGGDDLADLRREAVALLGTLYGQTGHILIKEPRIARLVPFWDRVLREFGCEPRYVLPLRNPRDVASSLAARNEMDLAGALQLWSDHVSASERDTRAHRRVFSEYGQFLRLKSREIERIIAALDLPLPPLGEAEKAEIDSYVSEEAEHHRSEPSDLFEVGAASVTAATLYGRIIEGAPPDRGGRGLVDALAAIAEIPVLKPVVRVKPAATKRTMKRVGRKIVSAEEAAKLKRARKPGGKGGGRAAAPAGKTQAGKSQAAPAARSKAGTQAGPTVRQGRRKPQAGGEAAKKPFLTRLMRRLRKLFRPSKPA